MPPSTVLSILSIVEDIACICSSFGIRVWRLAFVYASLEKRWSLRHWVHMPGIPSVRDTE